MRGKLLYILLALLCLAAVVVLLNSSFFAVSGIDVSGNDLIGEEQIQSLANIDGKTNIFRVNLSQVKAGIQASPYLEVLSVTRRLPDRLIVTVHERQVRAVVQGAENLYWYIDEEGRVLEQGETKDKLICPYVRGFAIEGAQVGRTLAETQGDPYPAQALCALLKELVAQDAAGRIEEIRMYNTEDIVMKTRDGYGVRVGQTVGLKKKVAWLIAVLPKLHEQGYLSGTLDLTGANQVGFNPNEDLFSAFAVAPAAPEEPSEEQKAGEGAPDQDGGPDEPSAEGDGPDTGAQGGLAPGGCGDIMLPED